MLTRGLTGIILKLFRRYMESMSHRQLIGANIDGFNILVWDSKIPSYDGIEDGWINICGYIAF